MADTEHCKHQVFSRKPTGDGPTCAKGHDIRKLVGGSSFGWFLRMPCRNPNTVGATCPDRELISLQELYAPHVKRDSEEQVAREILHAKLHRRRRRTQPKSRKG